MRISRKEAVCQKKEELERVFEALSSQKTY
jgi:hypothetical protein